MAVIYEPRGPAKQPTPKQIEAYRFVYIHACKHAEAAKLMGCSRSNVTHLLKKLKKNNPQLFAKKRHFSTLPLQESTDSQPVRKF
jgi:predicted DNA-binding protein (UPF0251 family)